ncbi:hypothetical protein N0V90_010239 [Kalmusia sp. IMI 367209]|nr:hypothetical protein N0V90_010239 [Kalmusia sp. IMI 367209]
MNTARQKRGSSSLGNDDEKQRKRQARSALLEFEASTGIKEYEYTDLPTDRNRIRLLRLSPGVLENPQIDCEMFQAEFDGDGKLRHIGDDGPTITRLRAILNKASLMDTLLNISDDLLSKARLAGPRNNPRPENNAENPPLEGNQQDPTPADIALRKEIDSYLETVGLVNIPNNAKLGDVLNNTSATGHTATNPHLDDILDSSALRNVLETRTLQDIVNIAKLEEILRAKERDELKHIKSEEVLNAVKLEEVLKGARLGKEISYEALSWRWGDEDNGTYTIMIKKNGILFKKRVSQTLGLALKYLRLNQERTIWIDAICINQKNLEERSFQVSLMSLVYTGAEEICVWIGEDDDESTKAIKFIKDEISQLKDFDRLCTDQQHSPKWKALLVLMQRAWFSRRWVVQEIALARKAKVYCGPDQISWGDLAIAVELFVEVETATHRLSELMKKDDVVPYWFEHVSELGASVLVSATARIFRSHRGGGYGPLTITKDGSNDEGPFRRSLLSLEYLVTSLSIFDCGRPHDSIYALIAIARDAAPHPPSSVTKRTKEALIAEVFSDALEQKPYPLDYNSPYPDVCKEFLHFCIKGASKVSTIQALDILCRPWAKDWRPKEHSSLPVEQRPQAKTIFKHEGGWQRRESNREYFNDAKAKWFKCLAGECEHAATPRCTRRTPASRFWFGTIGKDPNDSSGGTGEAEGFKLKEVDDLRLPSWVATTAGAPFDIFPHPGMDMVKMGRKNADPLVGVPQDGRQNYSAGQLRNGVNVDELKFRRRARLGHYSLYVKGFCFDQVDKVSHVSQSGAIPSAWLDLADWSKARRSRGPYDDPGDPPNEFWRTLVADRGMHNENPPYYYMRACKETIMKGGLRSNAVDTSALIYNERNSIVAEFCRRVQAVIWNRALIRTKKGKLGLASEDVRQGDWICVIYGCTVPVILRKNEKLKTKEERAREKYEDCIEALARSMRNAAKGRFRKARYVEMQKKSGWMEDVKEKLKGYKKKLDEEKEQAIENGTFVDVPNPTAEEDDDEEEVPDKDTEKEEEKSEAESEGDATFFEKRKRRQAQAESMDPFRHYEFIGEAYIHGMMDGEAVRQKFYKGKPDHVFELR